MKSGLLRCKPRARLVHTALDFLRGGSLRTPRSLASRSPVNTAGGDVKPANFSDC